MPIIHEHTTPQHQVLINQSIIKRVEQDVKDLKKDIDEINCNSQLYKLLKDNNISLN